MPEVTLARGGYVRVKEGLFPEPTILEVGHSDYGHTSVELDGLTEVERVLALIGSLAGEEPDER